MRTLWLLCAWFVVSGCGGFRTLSRGDWRLVYADGAKREADAKRSVITREHWEREVAEGQTRTWVPPPGYRFPALHETPSVGLTPGDIVGLIIDEHDEVTLQADGEAVALYWGPTEKRDVWVEDHDETVRESVLYVEGRRPGKATLRLQRGGSVIDVAVTVQ